MKVEDIPLQRIDRTGTHCSVGINAIAGAEKFSWIPPEKLKEFLRGEKINQKTLYTTDRGLNDRGIHDKESYNEVIGADLELLIPYICGLLGKDQLSVLDYGCGEARALKSIIKLEGVNAAQSVGVTAPHANIDFKSDDPVIVDSISNLAKRKNTAGFDLLISVFGILLYDPLKRTDLANSDLLSFSRALCLLDSSAVILGNVGIPKFFTEGPNPICTWSAIPDCFHFQTDKSRHSPCLIEKIRNLTINDLEQIKELITNKTQIEYHGRD